MTAREQYAPGPARGAEVHRDGEKWTLVSSENYATRQNKSGRR